MTAIKKLEIERDNWIESAAAENRNKIYYIGLLDEIAKYIGSRAFISDDGSIQDSPIRANLPGIIKSIVKYDE